jgi:hypothetical protein
MRDVHQQVIHKELYLASVVRAKNIGKTQAILRAKRVIAYKGAQTILGQILKTFNLKSIVEILHESIDKVKSTLIVVDKQESVDLILMYNLLEIGDKKTWHISRFIAGFCSQNLIYIYLQRFVHALLAYIRI